MSTETVLQLGQQCLWITTQIASPIVMSGLVIGTGVSVVQAATQIQEQSLVFVPKMLALMAALTLTGGWMLTRMTDFTRTLLISLPGMAN